jgi:hypothetical protein
LSVLRDQGFIERPNPKYGWKPLDKWDQIKAEFRDFDVIPKRSK